MLRASHYGPREVLHPRRQVLNASPLTVRDEVRDDIHFAFLQLACRLILCRRSSVDFSMPLPRTHIVGLGALFL